MFIPTSGDQLCMYYIPNILADWWDGIQGNDTQCRIVSGPLYLQTWTFLQWKRRIESRRSRPGIWFWTKVIYLSLRGIGCWRLNKFTKDMRRKARRERNCKSFSSQVSTFEHSTCSFHRIVGVVDSCIFVGFIQLHKGERWTRQWHWDRRRFRRHRSWEVGHNFLQAIQC